MLPPWVWSLSVVLYRCGCGALPYQTPRGDLCDLHDLFVATCESVIVRIVRLVSGKKVLYQNEGVMLCLLINMKIR